MESKRGCVAGLSEKWSLLNPPTVGQYLAGAFLGNAPLLFLELALTFVDPVFLHSLEAFLQVVVLSVMFVSGVLAGFMVARMAISRFVVVGLTTGFLCFLLNFLLSRSLVQLFFFGSYNGYVGLLFVVGGAFGGLLRQQQVGKLRRKRLSSR